MTEPAAAKAALDLNNKLRTDNPPWLVAVGYSTDDGQFSIIVYSTSLSKAEQSVPKSFQGVPVVVKKMGRPRPV